MPKGNIVTINIDIYGEEQSGKTIVGNIIRHSLSKAGFSDVSFINEDETDADVFEPETVLDAIRQMRPQLFSTPIIVCEIHDDEEEAESTELSDNDEATLAYIESVERATLVD